MTKKNIRMNAKQVPVKWINNNKKHSKTKSRKIKQNLKLIIDVRRGARTRNETWNSCVLAAKKVLTF